LLDIKKQNFKNLDVLHHYASGMKAVYSDEIYYSLHKIRDSLGGAGFSAWSGIPKLIEEFSPTITFEGDNTVMA
jgi:acyl-CoA oxidase